MGSESVSDAAITKELIKLVQFAVLEEREACARICWVQEQKEGHATGYTCADEIRQRSVPEPYTERVRYACEAAHAARVKFVTDLITRPSGWRAVVVEISLMSVSHFVLGVFVGLMLASFLF